MQRPRANRTVITVALIGAGVATMVGLSFLGGVLGVALESQWPSILAVVAAFAVGLTLAVLWWVRIDEAAREAHKWAWWWGGSTGMLVCLISLFLLSTDLIAFDTTQLTFSLGFSSGMLIILAGQIIGYTVAWIWWWISKR